jgi:hypothetical protein
MEWKLCVCLVRMSDLAICYELVVTHIYPC